MILCFREQSGQSILEVIVAMAIFALMSSAIAVMSVGSFTALMQGGEQTQAEALAQEGIEAIRSIHDRAWNEIIYSQSAISSSTGQWIFSGEGTDETIGQYTRAISFDDVCRDSADDITDCPGDYTDVHSQKVTADITWDVRPGVTNSAQRVSYLTNWDSYNWMQTNWIGGDGQSVWSDATQYDSDDGNIDVAASGQITLVSGGVIDSGFDLPTGTSKDWPFTTAGNYIYDTDDIQITGGVAELKQQGGAEESGDTTNPSFDTDSSGWIYNDWDQASDEENVTGTRNSSGGTPSGWIDVNFPAGRNDEFGGYWEQAFTTTASDPTATLNFDWQVTQYEETPSAFRLYVFVDSSPGAPTIGGEVWSSGEQTSAVGWVSVSDLDISSKVSSADTYYLKVAVWLETDGGDADGPYEIGYDNVSLHWEKIAGGSYPTNEPDIYPASSFATPSVQSWDSFIETADKNGGEIYYQLTNDDGVSWQYWNGGSWATAGATDYNTASVVNSNVGSFSIANEQIKFRAFLESDGAQLVQLDNINIGFSAPDPVWSFAVWGVELGEETPTGALNTSGGNPENYVDVTVPNGNNDEVGGVWTQSFTTYKDSPSSVTVDFDYKVIDFNGAPDIAQIRVYVDTASGDPTTQIGSSIDVSGEGGWTSATQIDASSAVTSVGTYYLKIVFYVETGIGGGSGPFNVGFDNVSIGLGDGAYSTSGALISSAFNMSDVSPAQVIEWDESLPSGTDIKFQIKTATTQGGLTGESWSSYFNTAEGELISADYNGNQWVQYRVELSGDGSETPVLEEVRVNYK